MNAATRRPLAAIALGANLRSRWGEPPHTLREAVRRLGQLGTVLAVSSLRETEPVGLREQPRFTNAAALLETDLPPLILIRSLLAVEQAMGRVRAADTPPKGPRVVDLDLLLYVDAGGKSLILREPELLLPHPAMHLRSFVLEPLAEIAPGLVHPELGATIAELLATLSRSAA